MTTKSKYTELWPTPVGEYWLEDMTIHEELRTLIENRYSSWDGDDTMNLFDTDCRFSLWVKDCVKDFTEKFNYHTEKVVIERGWCTVQHYLHDNFIHVHNTVDLAAVYYVDVVEGHPPLEIFDPREAHKFNRVNRLMADGNIASGFISLQFPPEKYKLLIHPGYLKHGVGINRLQQPRAAVAMNVLCRPSKDRKPQVVSKFV